jgi:glycosyltransferase involved in cell wall biosynthesis
MSERLRLALVVPRYGPEIGGGAEGLGRWVAGWLARHHDVTVLTTRALDHQTWADHYPRGRSRDGRVEVCRFPVPVPRVTERFNRWYGAAMRGELGVIGLERWMREQGPHSPELLAHLDREGAGYDAVLFVPYLYATTWEGLPLVADRSLLIPALHDEPPAAFPITDRTFRLARGLAFSTPEERDFCRSRFGPLRAESRLVGVGVDTPETVSARDPRKDPYLLYLGRIEPAKGCVDLLEYHRAARRMNASVPRLVMAGRIAMDLPEHAWLDVCGFVSEQEKADLLAGAAAVVLPSPYESLSMAVLECWMHGRPVIVSDRSPVLVGQVRRAAGGLWYSDSAQYAEAVALVAEDSAAAARLGAQGRRYARGRFRPEAVGQRLEELLRAVAAPRRDAA